MPKLKTNKAASKRYGFTAKRKVKRTAANSRHRLSTKTKYAGTVRKNEPVSESNHGSESYSKSDS